MRKLVAGVLALVVWLAGAQAAAAQPTPGFVEVSGSPFATGSSPRSVAFSPSGALVATANWGANSVSVFSVSSGGSLTAVSGSPFPTGNAPASVAFSPSGALVAVANGGAKTVSVYSVSSNGSLTPVSGSPFPAGADPDSVAFSPSGLVAVANGGANTVSVYSVSSNGSLTPVSGSPFPAGADPDSVAFNPDGGLLAVANGGANTVSVYSVSSNGSLTAVSGSPFPTGAGPDSVAFSQFLYQGKGSPEPALAVANGAANSVSMFGVDENIATLNGDVTVVMPVDGSPFPAGVGPASVAFSPTLLAVAVANRGDKTVSVFSVHPGEGTPGTPDSLAPLPGSPVRGSTASELASVAFSPGGGLLATANAATSNVSVFSVVDCSTQYNQGFNAGINSGYQSGFNAGWNSEFRRAWKAGFERGFQAARKHPRTVHPIGRSARIPAPAPFAYRQRDSVTAATGCDAVFNSAFNQTANLGFNFNNGFTRGWNSASKRAFNQGFRAGFADGRPRR